MKIFAILLGCGIAMISLPALAGPAPDAFDQFGNDLGVVLHHAATVLHDNAYRIATNVPGGVGIVQENYVDQHVHGGLAVITGSLCSGAQETVRFYPNDDGTYNTITTRVGCD